MTVSDEFEENSSAKQEYDEFYDESFEDALTDMKDEDLLGKSNSIPSAMRINSLETSQVHEVNLDSLEAIDHDSLLRVYYSRFFPVERFYKWLSYGDSNYNAVIILI
jgi:hypothetical protein